MGVLSAIAGGILASFFKGCKLSIKGPAAGLIVIVAGAVDAFGGGVIGWKMTLAAIVFAGLIQILFGVLKLGRLMSYFPGSVIHGMLAAIGLIIIAKQLPVLLNIDPEYVKGKKPLVLFSEIPYFIQNMDLQVACVGGVGLLSMLLWPKIKWPFLNKIPAPLIVLLLAIPLGYILGFKEHAPDYTLLKVGKLTEEVGLNADFSSVMQGAVFFKYTILIALVGSLESLLTVKAVDLMDPHKRTSNANADLIAVGCVNTLCGFFGGLPVISEVARSAANVDHGAQSSWANFWHGTLLLLFVLMAYPLLEMIPNTALAAMLIAVGLKLAHPREFVKVSKLGKEHLLAFIITILLTLLEDLLIGIASGMLFLAIAKRIQKKRNAKNL